MVLGAWWAGVFVVCSPWLGDLEGRRRRKRKEGTAESSWAFWVERPGWSGKWRECTRKRIDQVLRLGLVWFGSSFVFVFQTCFFDGSLSSSSVFSWAWSLQDFHHLTRWSSESLSMNVGGLQVGNDLCTAGRYMVIWIYNTHTHRVTGPAAGGEKKRTKMTVV